MAVSENGNPWETLKKDLRADLEKTQNELQEIELMLNQSLVEVNKLAQRNVSITGRLKQIHGHFDTAPRDEIRSTYDSALDTQQRLFVMREQVEKLQVDQKHIDRRINMLRRILELIDLEPPPETQSPSGIKSRSFATIEAIIQAQESERQRLSRQMHDGPAQALSNFILQTEIAMRLFDMDQIKAREELENLKDSATSTFKQVRDFIFELRPMMLDDLGLVPTLKRYVEALKGQIGKEVNLSVSGVERRFEPYLEVLIFRTVQELLSMAAHQSHASTISVQIDIGDANIRTTIDDNGQGYDTDEVLKETMGLKVVKDRVEMIGGNMDIDSHPGQGSRVMFQIPVGQAKQSVFT